VPIDYQHEDIFERYIEFKRTRRKGRTYISIRQHVLKFREYLQSVKVSLLSDIDTILIKDFLKSLPVMDATKNRYLTSLSGFFSWAGREGYSFYNPAKEVERLEENREEIFKPWSGRHYRIALKNCDGYLKDLLILLRRTGMRISEALSLSRNQAYLSEHCLRLERTKVGAIRVVPLDRATERILARRLLENRGERVFDRGDGKPRNQTSIHHKIKKIFVQHGIAPKGIHGLRATFIRDKKLKGWDWEEIMRVVGHKDPNTTLKHYYQTPDKDLIARMRGEKTVSKRSSLAKVRY
jgi:integrase